MPYITKNITRLQCQRDKIHAKAKSSGRNSHWENFKQFIKDVSKAKIKSHTQYLNEVIGNSLKTNPKTFWSYIKTCVTANIVIPSLHFLTPMKHILMLTKQMPKTTNFNPSSPKKTLLPQTKDLLPSHLCPTLYLEKMVSLNSSTN